MYLATIGVASRRSIDLMISQGRIKVNGVTAILGQRVEGTECIEIDGKEVEVPRMRRDVYIVLHKPRGYITTASDEQGRPTVLDLIDIPDRIFPVGRLDKDTTGVLILTNDGEFTYKLTHPKHNTEKVYCAVLDIPLRERDRVALSKGIDIGEVTTRPCEIEISPKDRRHVRIVLREGRNRQIRKMFAMVGYEVVELDRTSCAGITYQGLALGEWRYLTQDERSYIENVVG